MEDTNQSASERTTSGADSCCNSSAATSGGSRQPWLCSAGSAREKQYGQAASEHIGLQQANGRRLLQSVEQCCNSHHQDAAVAANTTGARQPAATQFEQQLREQRGQLEVELLTDSLELKQLDLSLAKQALRFRKLMNFYGLIEDATLLMIDVSSGGGRQPSETGEHEAGRPPASGARAAQTQRSPGLSGALARLLWFSLVLIANFLTVYVLVVHFLWELRRLDAKMTAYSLQQQLAQAKSANVTSEQQQQLAPAITTNGWSVLKDFLENFRRHLSRLFALALFVMWHRNCHQFELLFVDCRKYYRVFYDGQALDVVRAPGRLRGAKGSHPAHSLAELIEAREARKQLLAATGKFHSIARHRINMSIYLPIGHLMFNILAIVLFPVALIVQNNGERAPIQLVGATATATQASESATMSALDYTKTLALVGLNNFNAFHSAIHTAFHPFDHQINSKLQQQQQQQQVANQSLLAAAKRNEQPSISLNQSAAFCLAELFVYYIYIHGPRIICSTCLSLVLAIHHLCLEAFNRRLVELIRQAKELPLTHGDMVGLLKQYDLIAMLHGRIERAFRWSLLLWFSLMFVSCLMQIFTLTESTSAAFGTSRWSQVANSDGQQTSTSTTAAAAAAATATTASAANGNVTTTRAAEPNLVSGPNLLASTSPIAVMVARIVFVCYSPILIYVEAFKLEAESVRSSQLILSLSRRQDDLVAQSIEASLFEPLCLSVGPYFHLNKRSVASLLGAIVTFSVMFIELRTKSLMSGGGGGGGSPMAANLAASPNQASVEVMNMMGEQGPDGW